MAETIAQIEARILAEKDAQAALSGLNSPSQTAIYRTWIFIQAVTINLFQQTLDIFKSELEAKVAKGVPSSEAWIQDRVLRFQYSATVPQVVSILPDGSVDYATIDTTLRIITRASVITAGNKTVLVKVAVGEPPVAASAPQLSALQGYLTSSGDGTIAGRGLGIGAAGVRIVASSIDADKVFLDADIYFNGQYSSTISQSVIDAINNYLANIPFNGMFSVLKLNDAIQSVSPVIDIVINNLAIRDDTTAFGSKTYLIQNKTLIISNYQLKAGYVVEETTSGQTFADKLNFISQ